jgi:MOSC domain
MGIFGHLLAPFAAIGLFAVLRSRVTRPSHICRSRVAALRTEEADPTAAYLRLLLAGPFQEEQWLGHVLSFGEQEDAPALTVTTRDLRCSVVNLDPDTATRAPHILKAIATANHNYAGIYGAVRRIGRVSVGEAVFLRAITAPLRS